MTALLRLLAHLADRVLVTPPTTWESASYGLGPTSSRQRTPGSPAPAVDPLRRPVRSLDDLVDPYLRAAP